MPSSRRFAKFGLVVMGMMLSGAAFARAPRTPQVEVLLAGPGEELYARFGHVAFLVHDGDRPRLVYNYGYTNFYNPQLILSFLRGRSRFWLATAGFASTRRIYIHEDRSLAVQPLHLTAAQHRTLARLLVENAREENRYYVYHHFKDNCSTRLRDLLDRVTEGRLSREWRGVPTGHTLRDFIREGFAGQVGILLLTELLIGRVADQPVDLWAGAFLPRILSAALQRSADAPPLAAAPQELYRRQQPSPLAHDPLAGTSLLWGATGLFFLLMVAVAWRAPLRGRWVGLALVPALIFLGVCAILVWGVALVATMPELRRNELLLILWPTDLVLLVVAYRWWRGRHAAGRWLRGYTVLRLSVATTVLAGHLCGLLIQRPLSWVVMVWVLFAGLLIAILRAHFAPPDLNVSASAEDVYQDQSGV